MGARTDAGPVSGERDETGPRTESGERVDRGPRTDEGPESDARLERGGRVDSGVRVDSGARGGSEVRGDVVVKKPIVNGQSHGVACIEAPSGKSVKRRSKIACGCAERTASRSTSETPAMRMVSSGLR